MLIQATISTENSRQKSIDCRLCYRKPRSKQVRLVLDAKKYSELKSGNLGGKNGSQVAVAVSGELWAARNASCVWHRAQLTVTRLNLMI